MTAQRASPLASALGPVVATSARRWLHCVLELLLVGGLTPLLFALSWAVQKTIPLDASEYAFGFATFHIAFVVNDPHFAVTYLLFYQDGRARGLGPAFAPAQRLRWLLAGVVAPIALGAWAVVALAARSAPALGAMMELMFFLVGWHYVKQGFGVMTVLAARRGVRFTPGERAAILGHCFAGWAHAWANPAAPSREVEEKGVVYTALAHPAWLDHVTGGIFLATILPLAWVLLRKRRREGGLPILTPLVAMLASVWAWSIYSSFDPLVVYAVPALHSVQYLFMVWLLEKNAAKEREGPPSFGMSARARLGLLVVSSLVLGWVLFHGAPTALDDAFASRRTRFTALGPTPFFAAIYGFVNIHHYLMDAVIWRRENPRTRHLVATFAP
jgi:hypothetical protein